MFNVDGFLSNEIENIEKKFQKEFEWEFNKITEFNRFFQESSFKFIIQKAKLYHWGLAALYLRALSHYQSIIILSRKGITSESKIILRSLYEIKFIVRAISNNTDLILDYFGQEAIEMRKIIKNSRKWESELGDKFSSEEIEKKIIEIESEISQHKLKKFSIKNFAERADMLLDYEINYSILCLTSHSNMYDVKKHFILDDNGIISSFNWGPNKNDILTILGHATENMFSILDPLRDIFNLKIEDEYNKYFRDYNLNRHKFLKYK